MRQMRLFSAIGGSCEKLLHELDVIWDEVGENDEEKQKTLLEMQQECLDIFQRKVDQANRSRSNLHIMLADVHSEIVSLASTLGDNIQMAQLEKKDSSLKDHLAKLNFIRKQMLSKKEERLRLFQETRNHIQKIQAEIFPSPQLHTQTVVADDYTDLTQRKLEDMQFQLQALQREKNNRIYRVMEYVDVLHGLCNVLGFDFLTIVREIHPTLDESSTAYNQVKNISDDTLTKLSNVVESLKLEKRKRMEQIQELGASLFELWNLMDTPIEEQQRFQHVTSNIAASEHEINTPGALFLNIIEEAKEEVKRLEDLKASKLKELILRKQKELQEISKKSHIIPDNYTDIEKAVSSIEYGMVDPAQLLVSLEEEIGGLKEEALSRKDILEKVEKWMAFREEENWLEEYSKDENRYNSTRGAHLNLLRAERARVIVSKIPALVDSIFSRIVAWEEERGKAFLYDGVSLRSAVNDYKILKAEREEERRRNREQKKLHEQSSNEQEISSGSKSGQNGKTPSKKGITNPRPTGNGTQATRRLSLQGGGMIQQEAVLSAKPNGTPPVKSGSSTPSKETRFSSPGADSYQPSSESGTQITQPFMPSCSPVSTPRWRQSNNTMEEGSGLSSLLPIKTIVTPRRSSVSSASSATVTPRKSPVSTALMRMRENIEIEDENVISYKEIPTRKKIQGQADIQAIKEQVNTKPIQEDIVSLQMWKQLDPESQETIEFSFEEKRLAFISHYQLQKC